MTISDTMAPYFGRVLVILYFHFSDFEGIETA